jgi:Mn-dependent DtxR family transcriptional regulator
LNGVAQSENSTMSLHKLEGAGLVEMPTNEAIRLTERAVRALI